MEYLFSVIHESVVKSKSLQLRRLALLEMKRHSGEQFTTTLCWIDDAEEDCDISSSTTATLHIIPLTLQAPHIRDSRFQFFQFGFWF